MAGIEHGNVTNEEFMEEVARYECVYNRNSIIAIYFLREKERKFENQHFSVQIAVAEIRVSFQIFPPDPLIFPTPISYLRRDDPG